MLHNTCQKYADMCIYVVYVVVCTETYFMLQICTYWYIVDTYIVKSGQLWSVFVHTCQYILLIEWIWQGLMHTHGKPSQAHEPLHCNSKGRVYWRSTGWSDGKTIAHELIWKTRLPVPGSSALSHSPYLKHACCLASILWGIVPVWPAGTRGRRPKMLVIGTIQTYWLGFGR